MTAGLAGAVRHKAALRLYSVENLKIFHCGEGYFCLQISNYSGGRLKRCKMRGDGKAGLGELSVHQESIFTV